MPKSHPLSKAVPGLKKILFQAGHMKLVTNTALSQVIGISPGILTSSPVKKIIRVKREGEDREVALRL